MANLTEKEIEDIVEKVTERVIENVYTSVGRSVVTNCRLFLILTPFVYRLSEWLVAKMAQMLTGLWGRLRRNVSI